MDDNGLWFRSMTSTVLNRHNLVSRTFKPLLERASLPPTVRFHVLRRSAATLLLPMGVHPKVVQKMLGHATITVSLDTYSHVLPDMQDRP